MCKLSESVECDWGTCAGTRCCCGGVNAHIISPLTRFLKRAPSLSSSRAGFRPSENTSPSANSSRVCTTGYNERKMPNTYLKPPSVASRRDMSVCVCVCVCVCVFGFPASGVSGVARCTDLHQSVICHMTLIRKLKMRIFFFYFEIPRI